MSGTVGIIHYLRKRQVSRTGMISRTGPQPSTGNSFCLFTTKSQTSAGPKTNVKRVGREFVNSNWRSLKRRRRSCACNTPLGVSFVNTSSEIADVESASNNINGREKFLSKTQFGLRLSSLLLNHSVKQVSRRNPLPRSASVLPQPHNALLTGSHAQYPCHAKWLERPFVFVLLGPSQPRVVEQQPS